MNRKLHKSGSAPDTISDVLNLDEAAALMRVSTRTLRQDATEGKVPGQKVGREWRFSQKALEAHLAQPTREMTANSV